MDESTLCEMEKLKMFKRHNKTPVMLPLNVLTWEIEPQWIETLWLPPHS